MPDTVRHRAQATPHGSPGTSQTRRPIVPSLAPPPGCDPITQRPPESPPTATTPKALHRSDPSPGEAPVVRPPSPRLRLLRSPPLSRDQGTQRNTTASSHRDTSKPRDADRRVEHPSARRRARSPPSLSILYTRDNRTSGFPRPHCNPPDTITIMPNTSRNPDPPSPQTSTCPEDAVPRPDSATPPWSGIPATRTPSPSSMPELIPDPHAPPPPPPLPADVDTPATPRSATLSPGEGAAADEEGCDAEDGRKGWRGRREEGLDFREDGYSATSMGPDYADVRV